MAIDIIGAVIFDLAIQKALKVHDFRFNKYRLGFQFNL